MEVSASVRQLFQWHLRKFDAQHARHFSLVESPGITPLFTLSMVHIFSSFFLYPARREGDTGAHDRAHPEDGDDAAVAGRHDEEVARGRDCMTCGNVSDTSCALPCVTSAVILCPAADARHAGAHESHHAPEVCVHQQRGAAVRGGRHGTEAREAEAFHSEQLSIPTDCCAALLIVLLVLCLTS
ncbi:hypothetical protein DQ04_09481020 [Trypanosoma grayi]|uniref:hypothetical protein n=1 Tax=Trypanosoma grayi TaxID=71804 RepID=UPI0004F41FB2|nr:hypothetical protein DQ04_09481020 [Trypanosoma grayi]KEG07546.1 hypothetical protein DQ04_09481020 [Trypanosoma grayi]